MNFKQYLDTLRLSAKDAIVDGERDSLNDLKKYLHIVRPMEQELSRIIAQAANSEFSTLILLLGNVGDGKSHLLAKMWELHGDLLSGFEVHNDATESKSKDKTYLENLAEVFEPYRDDVLAEGSLAPVRTIIAINLGTLTNFLEETGDEFSILKKYVAENHLIDQQYQFTENGSNVHFQALNLTDYHIFTLSEKGVQSEVLLTIMDRVTKKTADNEFYQAYLEFYSQDPYAANCPMKYNYDLLSRPEVQHAISDLLVKIILADKLIISVRLLMNLIYDLIVPPSLSQCSEAEIQILTKQTAFQTEFYKHTLPALLFNSPATSNILRYVAVYDPVSSTNEEVDEMIIKLSTVANPAHYFSVHHLLESLDPLYERIPDLSIKEKISLFLRLRFLKQGSRVKEDAVFGHFVKHLYDFNSGKKRELLPLYNQVSHAVYQWNGTTRAEAGFINLDVGRKQNTYKISQKLQLAFVPNTIKFNEWPVLNKFLKTVNVGFQVEGHPNQFDLEIDYSLYQLIVKINKGYRPNRIDKSVHVKFTQFVDELVKYQSETKELIIQEFNGENRSRFKLTFIPGFDDFQFTEG